MTSLSVVTKFDGTGAGCSMSDTKKGQKTMARKETTGLSANSFRVQPKDDVVPKITLSEFNIPPSVLELLPAQICRRLVALPLARDGTRLIVAMAKADAQRTAAALQDVSELRIDPVFSEEPELIAAVLKYYP